jgi:lipoprotein signal peptidase
MHTSPNRPKNLLLGGLTLFVVVAGLDWLIKKWALSLTSPLDLGFFRFFATTNEGILGGYLSELHPWIIRIFFSVLFGFLCIAGILIIHLMEHKPVARLKWGIMVYLSGVLGNIAERMSSGRITDFAIFDLPVVGEMAFNFADLVVVIGFVMIAISVLKDAHLIWFEGSQRRGHWVEPKFQRSFGLLFVLVGFSHFAVIAVYSFTYLKAFIAAEGTSGLIDAEKIIFDYLTGLFVLEGGALFLTFAISVFFYMRRIIYIRGLAI